MTDSVPFERVAIVGLGLMGGSLARALRALERPPVITAVSREADDLSRARAAGIVAVVSTDAAEIIPSADLVIYATPIEATLELLGQHSGIWQDHAVVSDLGSIKAPVVEAAKQVGLAGRFVGGHPMAGDHRSGFAAARPDLFRGARIWLTPSGPPPDLAATRESRPTDGHDEDRDPVFRLAGFWRALGGEPLPIEAEAHDALMASVSHLPQLLASALANVLAAENHRPAALGPGGRDMTRLAGSSPAMWAGILLHNRENLRAPLAEIRAALDAAGAALENEDEQALTSFLETARRWSLDHER